MQNTALISVELELDISRSPVAGRLISQEGAQSFSSWTGLLAALQRLVPDHACSEARNVI
jgi:hypothetical protein